jgi:aryl-alcohol dehydrogenase-like predicted oxidoreductase
MRTRSLGDGGPEVTVVGLGCNNFGRRADLEQTRAVIDAALDEGVTLLDTADIYGPQGTSETYMGEVLEGRRDRIVLATKFGMPFEGAPEIPRGSRDYIRWAISESLRRLRTDVIDVYQMHQPDPDTPVEETLTALHELVQEGKVRWIGSSNFSPEQVEEADRIARERGLTRFVAAQNRYSFVHRERGRAAADVRAARIGVLQFFPLASGLLTGKRTRGVQARARAARKRDIPDERVRPRRGAAGVRRRAEVPLLDVAIGDCRDLAIAAVIMARRSRSRYANVKAGAWEPTADDLAALRVLR